MIRRRPEILDFEHKVRQDRKSSTCQKCRQTEKNLRRAIDGERRRLLNAIRVAGIIGEGPRFLCSGNAVFPTNGSIAKS